MKYKIFVISLAILFLAGITYAGLSVSNINNTNYAYTPSKTATNDLSNIVISDIVCKDVMCSIQLLRDDRKLCTEFFKVDATWDANQILAERNKAVAKCMKYLENRTLTTTRIDSIDIGGGGNVTITK